MNNSFYDKLSRDIKEFEGCELQNYKCPADKWTIGYGHNLESRPITITQEQASSILADDLKESEDGAVRLFPEFYTYPDSVQYVLISMVFQMGQSVVSRFPNMCAAVKDRDWKTAFDEALDSKWAKEDSPARAVKVASYFLDALD